MTDDKILEAMAKALHAAWAKREYYACRGFHQGWQHCSEEYKVQWLEDAHAALTAYRAVSDEAKDGRSYQAYIFNSENGAQPPDPTDVDAERDSAIVCLDRIKAAIFDAHYGNGISAAYAREVSSDINALISKISAFKNEASNSRRYIWWRSFWLSSEFEETPDEMIHAESFESFDAAIDAAMDKEREGE